MVYHEIQAIILAAGKGSRMTELTSSTPKCLLPVGNQPMIFFPLQMLEKANFSEVLIIVPDVHETEITKALTDKFSASMRLETFPIPFSKDLGTADSLRMAKDKIKSDVLLISCDTITDFPIYRMINLHRVYETSLTVLVSATCLTLPEGSVPGRRGKAKPEKDLIGIDYSNENRLVYLSSAADFEEMVPFRTSMIAKCPSFKIHSNYLDSHIYILKKWVINYIVDNTNISSVKGELLPLLIRKQFKLERRKLAEENRRKHHPASILSKSAETKGDIFSYLEKDPLEDALETLNPLAGHHVQGLDKSRDQRLYPASKIKCFAYLLKEGLCVRTNHLAGYSEVCKQIPRYSALLLPLSQPSTPVSPMKMLGKVIIGNDCLVGDYSTIGDKTSIKRSVVGKHCKIGDKVKVANSVVMDHVVIEEGCNVTGSILCSGSHLGASADIKDCIVSSGQDVVSLGKFANEVIMDVGHLMEL